MKVKIDKDKCIGCGTCVALAPKTFKLGKDAKVVVIESSKDGETKIKEAIDSCPVDAIELAG